MPNGIGVRRRNRCIMFQPKRREQCASSKKVVHIAIFYRHHCIKVICYITYHIFAYKFEFDIAFRTGKYGLPQAEAKDRRRTPDGKTKDVDTELAVLGFDYFRTVTELMVTFFLTHFDRKLHQKLLSTEIAHICNKDNQSSD